MKITNKLGLPTQLVKAVEGFNAEYQKSKTGKENYSVTQLINPGYQIDLQKKHRDDIEEDISDSIWMLLGNSIHSILERAGDDKSFVEERLSVNVDDTIISGAMDYFTKNLLQDYKVTSVYSIIYKSRIEDWTQQLNIYRYLIHKNLNYNIEKMQVVAILRDWSKSKAMQGGDYPKNNIAVIDLNIWDYEKTEQFMRDRIENMRQKTPCTKDERWEKPTKYAVMKEGRKSAVKLFENEDLAKDFLNSNKDKEKMHIDTRLGECTRCKDYCSVNKWCDFYKSQIKC